MIANRSLGVLLVDDHQILRDGLRHVFRRELGFEILGEAPDGKTACEIAARLRPELIILDVSLPDCDGISLIPRLLVAVPTARVLVLSAEGDAERVRRALQLGASGYVLKLSAPAQLVEAARLVASGGVYVSPELTADVLAQYQKLLVDHPGGQGKGLSEREKEVLKLIADGCNTKEIAARLTLSVKTVESHRLRIMDKLNLHSVAELTKYALRKGMTSA